MSSQSTVYSARYIVIDSQTILKDSALIVQNGVIKEIAPIESIRRKSNKSVELHSHILHPGFVNAHCHLDLSFLRGKLKARQPFVRWLEAVISARKTATKKEIDTGMLLGAKRLIETGTTTVGDISSDGGSTRILASIGLRGVIFHETLGYPKNVCDERLDDLIKRFGATPASPFITHGVSPHALYSTSAKLMEDASRFAKKNSAPVAIHTAETEEEVLFSTKGSGPLKDFLDKMGLFTANSHPTSTPVFAIKKAGALNSSLLIHLNHPARGDLAKIKTDNAKVAYCPMSNKWFGRGDKNHPLLKLLAAKIPVGLGTDSLASNNDLDMTAEMRQTLKNFVELTPSAVFDMATRGGSEALSLPKNFGTLRVGAPFDAVAIKAPSHLAGQKLFRAIMSQKRKISAVWIGGKKRYTNGEV